MLEHRYSLSNVQYRCQFVKSIVVAVLVGPRANLQRKLKLALVDKTED